MSLTRSLLAAGNDSQADIMARAEVWTPGGGGFMRKTLAGEVISPGKAMTVSTWFACIRAISEDIGKLPWILYRRQDKRGKERATDHPLFKMLARCPNPEQTSQTFRELLNGWALSWGYGYAEIETDSLGRPVNMWPIHPSRGWLHRVDGEIKLDVSMHDSPFTADGKTYTSIRLDYKNVFHLRAFGDDPLNGISVAKLAAESLGITLAAQQFGASFFGNGAMPTILLSHPGRLDEPGQTNLRESWKKRAGGSNKNGVMVVSEGIKMERISIPPEDAQFLETRQFQRDQIAEWFRIPPHKVGNLARSTNNNIEHQGIEYVTDTIMPWLVRWEQEAERKLLDEREQEEYDIEILADALMRGDSQARANFYRTMISTAAMMPNEARALENLPDAGPAGDQLYMQGAMTTLDRIAKGETKPAAGQPGRPAEDDPEEQAEKDKTKARALLPVFVEAADRCRRKEEMAIESAARRFAKDPKGLKAWAVTFYGEHVGFLASAFGPCFDALSAVLGRPLDGSVVSTAVRGYCERGCTSVSTTGLAHIPDQTLAETILTALTLEP